MNDIEFSRTRIVSYLIWVFALAYILQVGASLIYNSGNKTLGQLVIMVMMFVPMLSVSLSGGKLSGMGWKLRIRKNTWLIICSWLSPIALTAIGAGLYFLIFPEHFTMSGEYLTAIGGVEMIKQMEEQGISYSMYVFASIIGSVVYAPLVNAFLALGEEAGWRGFLYPQLKAKFGRKRGWLLGGVIWGMWHWPLIGLIGYEYGAIVGNHVGYVGYPVVGMLLFCVVAIGWGILHDWLYEKSGSIWLPAIFHGAINAAATIPLLVCIINTSSARLLGPAPMGVIAGLPFLTIAIILLFHKSK